MPVPQDARLALNAIEPLERLKVQLNDPSKVSSGVTASFNIQGLIQEIDAVIASLNEMVSLASGGNAEAAQQELQEEAQLRSQGQQQRHDAVENCVPGQDSPENLPGRRPRTPQKGRRMPLRGTRIPQAVPRLPIR